MNFRAFLNESFIQAEPGDIRFLQAILDNASDSSIPLVFADYLEERGRPEGTYLRHKVEKQPLPKEFIPLDNWFFQGVRQDLLMPDKGRYERIMGNDSDPGYQKEWQPIINGKSYGIEGNKVTNLGPAGGGIFPRGPSYHKRYSPEKHVFYHYLESWRAFQPIDNPPLDLYWLMAVNVLKLEGVVK